MKLIEFTVPSNRLEGDRAEAKFYRKLLETVFGVDRQDYVTGRDMLIVATAEQFGCFVACRAIESELNSVIQNMTREMRPRFVQRDKAKLDVSGNRVPHFGRCGLSDEGLVE